MVGIKTFVSKAGYNDDGTGTDWTGVKGDVCQRFDEWRQTGPQILAINFGKRSGRDMTESLNYWFIEVLYSDS